MSGRISGRVVNDGLVLHLDAANPDSYISGSTTWNDLSFNQGIMTTTGGPVFSGSNVGSVNFDNIDDFFNSNLILQPTNLTISCWFKGLGPPTPNDSFGGCLLIHTPQSIIGYSFAYSWASQRVTFSTLLNDYLATSDGTVLQNTIYNVTCTYDGVQQIIYINGNLSTSRPYSTITYPSSGDRFVRLGNWNGSFKRNFNGNIYQMLLYNRALTASEAKQNFLALKGRFGL